MKLAVKSAWMCASGVFLVTAMPPFLEKIAPFGYTVTPGTLQGMAIIELMIFSLMGSLMAGAIGYIIGDILANPQGKEGISNHTPASTQPLSTLTETGNETLLADLEPLSSDPLPSLQEFELEPNTSSPQTEEV